MKKTIFLILLGLVCSVGMCWADQTYHVVTPNITKTQYEAYQIYNATTSCVIKAKKTTFNSDFEAWVGGGIYDYGSSDYAIPGGVTAANWLAASGKGAKIRDGENGLVFYVTNCVGVTVLGKAGGTADNKKLSLSVKEGDTEVNSIALSTNTSVHELSYGTALDPTKNYKITVACTGNQNSEFYQIRFEGPTVIGTYEWATFVSDKILNFAGSPVAAYIVTGHEGSTLTLEQMTGTVPAYTPLLINAPAGYYTIPTAANTTTNVNDNKLKAGAGAAVAAEANKTKYVLSVDDGKAAFKLISSTAATVPAGKAYLEFAAGGGAPSIIRIVDEENNATNIEAIEDVEDAVKFFQNGKLYIKKNGVVYDIMGTIVK